MILNIKFISGEEQWHWLEKAFGENKDLYLIASGINFIYLLKKGSQILPEDRILHENWFPQSSKRLIDLIRESGISGKEKFSLKILKRFY